MPRALIEAYVEAADRRDAAAALAMMTPDCIVEYLAEEERYEGQDGAAKAFYEARAKTVASSWHGDYTHTADPQSGRVATRFAVRRTDHGTAARTGDNINLFQFESTLIKRISVWRGPPLKRG
ncbi:MAG: nuclear transport factor 2 family protein [Burkholderiales bacterium]|nr:nuclear transport factor 2 family protein [Burkholderiales bacterium]